MIHDFSPFLLRFEDIGIGFFGPDFGIRWYGLSYLTGFLVAYIMILWLVSRQRAGFEGSQVGDFVTTVAISILLGGRFGYCLFYSPNLLVNFRASFPWWGFFAVHEGGMASHGGIIGAILACIVFAHRHQLNSFYLMDLCSFVAPIGIFFGRVSNFINGELVGRPIGADFPYGVKFPQDMNNWINDSPEKLKGLSSVIEKVGLTKEQWLEAIVKAPKESAARIQLYEGVGQIITQLQRGSEETRIAIREALDPILIARHPSQLYAALGEGILLFMILFFLWRRPRKPGIIGANFVVFYALIRIADEMFRAPDLQIGFGLFGLTRGQWLSVGMLGIGLLLMIFWGRANALYINGWTKGQTIRLGRK